MDWAGPIPRLGCAPELMLLWLAATFSAGFAGCLLSLDRWGSVARSLLGSIAHTRMLSLRHMLCITVALVIAVRAWLGFRLPLLHLQLQDISLSARGGGFQMPALLQQQDLALVQIGCCCGGIVDICISASLVTAAGACCSFLGPLLEATTGTFYDRTSGCSPVQAI